MLQKSKQKAEHKLKKIIKRSLLNENQTLNLQGNKATWMEILKERKWAQLKKLWLGNCEITDNNIQGIYVQGLLNFEWSNLAELRLYDNQITGAGIKKLSKHQWPNLKLISLTRNCLGDNGLIQVLTLVKQIQHLNALYLDCNNITSLKGMVGCELSGLLELALDGNRIGCVGVKMLVKAGLGRLNKLFLNDCQIQNQGGLHLSKGNWPTLHTLRLTNNNLTHLGLTTLTLDNLPSIKIINIEVPKPIQMLLLMANNWRGTNIDRNWSSPRWRRSRLAKIIEQKMYWMGEEEDDEE